MKNCHLQRFKDLLELDLGDGPLGAAPEELSVPKVARHGNCRRTTHGRCYLNGSLCNWLKPLVSSYQRSIAYLSAPRGLPVGYEAEEISAGRWQARIWPMPAELVGGPVDGERVDFTPTIDLCKFTGALASAFRDPKMTYESGRISARIEVNDTVVNVQMVFLAPGWCRPAVLVSVPNGAVEYRTREKVGLVCDPDKVVAGNYLSGWVGV